MSASQSAINDGLYQANRARLQQAQARLNEWNAMNEEGKANYDRLQAELARKVREGEEARLVNMYEMLIYP